MNEKKYVSKEMKDRIEEIINFKGSNYKEINFWKMISEDEEGYTVEIGYRITYIGCRPKYNKDTIWVRR